jgi:hypothetical protein
LLPRIYTEWICFPFMCAIRVFLSDIGLSLYESIDGERMGFLDTIAQRRQNKMCRLFGSECLVVYGRLSQ